MAEEKRQLFARFRLNSLVVATLGVVLCVMALQLPLGTFAAPGAGMWPLLISATLTVIALVLLFTEGDGHDYEPLTKRSWITLIGFVWIAAFIVMFTYVGLTISAFVFSFVWLRWLAKESWRITLIGSLGFTVAFVVIFGVLLRVPMPHDPVLSLLTTGRF